MSLFIFSKRVDLLAVRERLIEGTTFKVCAMEHFEAYAKYHRFFERFGALFSPRRSTFPEVTVLWGPPGVGKSGAAAIAAPSGYRKAHGTIWWDGFDGEQAIILDDFDGLFCPFKFLQSLLDRYPLRVECKGGSIEVLSSRIIITSNFSPRAWYPHLRSEEWQSLYRRICGRVWWLGHPGGVWERDGLGVGLELGGAGLATWPPPFVPATDANLTDADIAQLLLDI